MRRLSRQQQHPRLDGDRTCGWRRQDGMGQRRSPGRSRTRAGGGVMSIVVAEGKPAVRGWRSFFQDMSLHRAALSLLVAAILLLVLYPFGRMLFRTLYNNGAFPLVASVEALTAPCLGRMVHDTSIDLCASEAVACAHAYLYAWIKERQDAGC